MFLQRGGTLSQSLEAGLQCLLSQQISIWQITHSFPVLEVQTRSLLSELWVAVGWMALKWQGDINSALKIHLESHCSFCIQMNPQAQIYSKCNFLHQNGLHALLQFCKMGCCHDTFSLYSIQNKAGERTVRLLTLITHVYVIIDGGAEIVFFCWHLNKDIRFTAWSKTETFYANCKGIINI